jgi:hypothetical protein
MVWWDWQHWGLAAFQVGTCQLDQVVWGLPAAVWGWGRVLCCEPRLAGYGTGRVPGQQLLHGAVVCAPAWGGGVGALCVLRQGGVLGSGRPCMHTLCSTATAPWVGVGHLALTWFD